MHDIVMVFESGFGSGGAERVALHLIHYWLEQGRKVKLITMRGPEDDFYHVPLEAERIVLSGIASSHNKIMGLLNNIPRILRIRKALKQSGAQVVISFQTRTNIRTILASFALDKYVIISERNDPSRQLFAWPWPWLRKILYRYADIATANSHIALESMGGYVPNRNLFFVPNPVIIPDSQALLEHTTKVLNVSSLKPQKGHRLLIEAFAILGEKGNTWTLDLVGEGAERDNLAMLAQTYGLSERVSLHGLVADPSSFYLSAGLFVFPSLYEGTPNALLEAMAYGLPCIVSDSLPGALEHIKDGVTGQVFRSGDAGDLAKKITILINDKNMRVKLGGAARECMRTLAPEKVLKEWDVVINPNKHLCP